METYEISNSLRKVIKEEFGLDIEPLVEVSNDLSRGDYTTNIAMTNFGSIKNPTFAKASTDAKALADRSVGKQELRIKNPMELAQKIIELLNSELIIHNTFRLVEAKAPGFINFWLSDEEIKKSLNLALKDFNSESEDHKSSIIFEFGDPNPFKEPHIGHLRNLVLGESICRLLESVGKQVIRANYEGDVGLHVAKALWGIQNSKFKIQNFDHKTLRERVKFLAESYTVGAKAYEEDENAKEEIISINNKIYRNSSEIMEIWEKGRKWSLDYFEILYKKLGIKYDNYYFESETGITGLEIVKENSPKVFQKDSGALIFRGEKLGLHTRVFVTAEGYATYEGKDLGLAFLKEKDYPKIDRSIIMTANEQTDYFKVLLKALEMVDKKISDKTSHLSFGFVNLKDGKMSSRAGNVVSAFWLIEEIKKRLKKGFKEVSDEVLEDLSVGAVKWSMLKFSRESNISFSIDESIDLAGNSGPYMQYTYARISSLLSKSSNGDFEANSVKSLNGDLLALARIICQFKIVVNSASNNFSPNILSNYLYNLAQNFNNYYEKEKVIGSPKEEEKLVVIKSVGEVLKKGLYLLGIASPAKI